jgi:CheY-like chemotaxis protein
MTQPRAHVLVVDDDLDMRRSLVDALAQSGYRTTGAANGEEALAALAVPPLPDVILLDLLMPVMNGWQFCQAKMKNATAARIPVIVMSAAVSKDPASPYYIQVDDFLPKPVELDELLAKLVNFTRRPRMAVVSQEESR